MFDKKQINDLLLKVVYKMQNLNNETELLESCPISIIDIKKWEWAQGVGLYGLQKYYEETGNEEVLKFLISWYDANIAAGLPEKNVNTMCPMLTLSYVYEYTKNEKYLVLCKEWAQWVIEEMPRTEEMGLQHIVSGHENRQQLWDDTLFMTVLFLARMGNILGRKDYIQESIRQFLVHIKYLADKKTGLLFHGWTFDGRHNFSEAKWGRGNCWYTAGVVDYLDIVVGMDEGVKMYLLDTLMSQVKTLRELQDTRGSWHTLLDENETYLETSATAGFAYGILKAVRKGYIPHDYMQCGIKAVKAVLDCITQDGTVTGVSYGTGIGRNLDYYRKIPICPMTYGQALTVLLLSEVLKLDGFN